MNNRSCRRFLKSIAITLFCVSLMTAVIYFLQAGVANISMLYLLVVIAVALFLGRLSAVIAALLSFLFFDWFFVEPKYHLTVHDPAEWLALCMFLLTAIVTGQLTALLRDRVEEAQRLSTERGALAAASWTIASELDSRKALTKVLEQLAIVLPFAQGELVSKREQDGFDLLASYPSDQSKTSLMDESLVRQSVNFVFCNRQVVGIDSKHWQKAFASGETSTYAYLPVIADEEVLGVLCLKLAVAEKISADRKQVVDSLLNHAAVILQREKFMKAEAQAQAILEADKLKTALLSMVTHDFRSPLTAIKASVGSLMEGAFGTDAENEFTLSAIDQEADRLNKMVGNILNLSRLEAGAWKPLQEITSLSELVGAALDSFSVFENKRIVVKLESKLREIYVDPVQLVQVLRNLLENALKYSPPDTEVVLESKIEEDQMVLKITDCGVGLPKGEEQKIFEPFYRAPALKESSCPGVGIGLAICRGLVEANGGKIMAHNNSGGGAVFRVSLPLLK